MNSPCFYSPSSINCRGKLVSLDIPKIMGILNINDDSFYAGSRFMDAAMLLVKVGEMIAAGASFIDIGAMSTRPGAKEISVSTEVDRLKMALEVIKSAFPEVLISIDTYRVEVLQALESYPIDLVNDVSGGVHGDIWSWTANHKIPYLLMHMKGTPQTMNQLTQYEDIIKEMLDYFISRIEKIRAKGVHDILLDPGIGFAKTIEHNFYLLKHLQVFHLLELPLVIGLSRKSLIWKTLSVSPEEALNGTTALHMWSLQQGVKILRVHDVRAAAETILLWRKINESIK